MTASAASTSAADNSDNAFSPGTRRIPQGAELNLLLFQRGRRGVLTLLPGWWSLMVSCGQTAEEIHTDFPALQSREKLDRAIAFTKVHPLEIKAYLAERQVEVRP